MRRIGEVEPAVPDLVEHGVTGEPGCKPSDLAVERRGEEHGLPVGTEHLEDARHVGQEPHIEHAIGLIEHADAHLIEPEQPARHEIDQPAGGGHEDVGTPRALGLRADADAAVHGGDLKVFDVGDHAELLGHLAGELAGRRQDQRGRTATARRQQLDERRGERERLARSGPGAREDVASGEGVGDHEGLDLEGSFGPSHTEGPRHRLGDAELAERRRGGASEPLRLGRCSLHVSFLRFLWISGARARRKPGGRPRRERPGTAKRARDRETSSRRVSGRDPQDVHLTAYPIWEAGGRDAHRIPICIEYSANRAERFADRTEARS